MGSWLRLSCSTLACVAMAAVVPLMSAVDDPGAEPAGRELRGDRRARRDPFDRGDPGDRARRDAKPGGGGSLFPGEPLDPVRFFHFRKAGGSTVLGALKRAGCKPTHEEWAPLRAGPRAAAFSLTNFREPLARLLSAYVFEGAAPQCRCGEAGGPCDCGASLEPCEARVAGLDVGAFPAWLAASRARQAEAFEHQIASKRYDAAIFRDGARECGATARGCHVGHHCVRHYIRNYYTRMLLADDGGAADGACGAPEAAGAVGACHADAAFDRLWAVFDCVVVFDGGVVHRVSPPGRPGACESAAPPCVARVDWERAPTWSYDGYGHEETEALDGALRALRRAHVAALQAAHPGEFAALAAENAADLRLFARLKALIPTP